MHNKHKQVQIPKSDSSPQSWKVKVVSLADVKALPKLQQSLPQISQREEPPVRIPLLCCVRMSRDIAVGHLYWCEIGNVGI